MTAEQIAQRQVAKISRISSLEELDGYESEARKRGLTSEEMAALARQRKRLA